MYCTVCIKPLRKQNQEFGPETVANETNESKVDQATEKVCETLIILMLLCVIMLTEKLTESFGFMTVVDAICYILNTGLNIGIFVVSGQLNWKIVVIHIWKMIAPMLGIVGVHIGK